MTPDQCPCGEPLEHQVEHPGECCDCFDLGFGCPLDKINAERAARGAPPLAKRHESSPGEGRGNEYREALEAIGAKEN